MGSGIAVEALQVVFVAPDVPTVAPAPTDTFHQEFRLGVSHPSLI
jgi:hypothetical protein